MPFLYMTTHILNGLEVMLRDLALLLKCQLDIKLIKLCFLFVLRDAHAWHSLHCLIRPWERVVDSHNYSNQPTAQELHTISVYHRNSILGVVVEKGCDKSLFRNWISTPSPQEEYIKLDNCCWVGGSLHLCLSFWLAPSEPDSPFSSLRSQSPRATIHQHPSRGNDVPRSWRSRSTHSTRGIFPPWNMSHTKVVVRAPSHERKCCQDGY